MQQNEMILFYFISVKFCHFVCCFLVCVVTNRQWDYRNSRSVRVPTSGVSQFEKQQDCSYSGPWLSATQISQLGKYSCILLAKVWFLSNSMRAK